ncbi:Response regulator receiver domain-containing protein [Cryptosporangium aurantiacum]|uniref:Response regulator receiver domain-containing protein n=2 Tax=Cryptosporangium aurantiacum TaxID=134849 RepID=A0A1M7Q3L4_9ACTN|nr:Response regulator receiver domain-containing protein [Cryptosporangium aurantiacum]
MLDLMALKLREAGHTITTTRTGAEGLSVLHAERPDLVLLDVLLPDTTGLEFCETVRADTEIRDTLVVMVSASASQRDVGAGLAAGADDYVTKPFAPSKLVGRIAALLSTDR